MRKIELSMVIGEATRQQRAGEFYTDSDEPGEGRPPAPAAVEPVTPTAIDPDWVRSVNRRKGDRVGCRITFKDGGGFAVTDTYDEVIAAVWPTIN